MSPLLGLLPTSVKNNVHAAHIVRAGAGESVIPEQANLFKLFLIPLLRAVHHLEYYVLQKIGRNVLIHRPRVGGELLLGGHTRSDKLVHEVEYALYDDDAKACDYVAVGRGYRHHFCSAEGLAVHDEGLHYLGVYFALTPVKYGLLFSGKFHMISPFAKKHYSAMATSHARQMTVRRLPMATQSPTRCT